MSITRLAAYGTIGYLAYQALTTARAASNLRVNIAHISQLRIVGGEVRAILYIDLFNTVRKPLEIQNIALDVMVANQMVGTAWTGASVSPEVADMLLIRPGEMKRIYVPVQMQIWKLATAVGLNAIDAFTSGGSWKSYLPQRFGVTGRITANNFPMDVNFEAALSL